MFYTNFVIAWCLYFRMCYEWINSRFKNNDRQGKSGSSGKDFVCDVSAGFNGSPVVRD